MDNITITIATLVLQINPLKMFWIGVMLFCVMSIAYQYYITNGFEFERHAKQCYRVQQKCNITKRRYDLVRVGEEEPRNEFERTLVKMPDHQYFNVVYQMLYQHEATRLIAGSYKAAYRAELASRGYYRTPDAVLTVESDKTSPLSDRVSKLPIEGQRVSAPIDSVGEDVENSFEFEPVLTTKGYRAKLR